MRLLGLRIRRKGNQPGKMLLTNFISAAFMAIALNGEHYAFGTQKTMGELMLFPTGDVEARGIFDFNYDLTVLFHLYTRLNTSTPQQLVLGDEKAFYGSHFDPKKKTLLVIHGFQGSVNSNSVQYIKNAALEFHDVNVIGVDWNYFSRNPNYLWVVSKVDDVGAQVGKLIQFLISHGQKTEDLHLIGHSLGAHVAGLAGKALKANGHTAARITGLDPALPGFSLFAPEKRLDSEDAEFVDCIHTCGGKLGQPFPICQADFYPNGGGDVQPGCSVLDFGTCSHGRSYEFFAESMNPRHLFYAQSCKAIALHLVPLDCDYYGALMGYPALPRFKGALTLQTNSKRPFAKNITE